MCEKIWINYELYDFLSSISNPCDPKNEWFKIVKDITPGALAPPSGSATTKIYQISINPPASPPKNLKLRPYYILKVQPLSSLTINEAEILEFLSQNMLEGLSPILFPFLYKKWVCDNNMHLLLQPAEYSVLDYLPDGETEEQQVKFWTEFLYQISRAVYFLENNKINHNDINLNNIMFQVAPPDATVSSAAEPLTFAISLIDFGSAVKNVKVHSGLPPFVLGRDLNYFLYELIYSGVPNNYFPKKLADQLEFFISYHSVDPVPGEDNFLKGLRMANLIKSNPKSSGKYISRWLLEKYPNVSSSRCNPIKINKFLGVAFGGIVGDALGSPMEFSDNFTPPVKDMHNTGDFNGLLSEYNLAPGTFTDDTSQSLALIDAILINKRVEQDKFAAGLVRWYKSDPLDVGTYTKKVLSQIKSDGSNWKEISKKVYESDPDNASNGCVMRAWPIPIFKHYDSPKSVIDAARAQANVTHLNSDSVGAAIFVSLLSFKLINGVTLEQAIEESYKVIEDDISYELGLAITEAHKLDKKDISGGTGWIVDTMNVCMWSLLNTKTFQDAVVTAANIEGDTDTNASITGAIAGALYGYDNIPQEWLNVLDKNKLNIWPPGSNIVINNEKIKDLILTLAGC